MKMDRLVEFLRDWLREGSEKKGSGKGIAKERKNRGAGDNWKWQGKTNYRTLKGWEACP